jgi:hypothetical protein
MVNATQENIGKSVYFLVVIIFVALVKPVLAQGFFDKECLLIGRYCLHNFAY